VARPGQVYRLGRLRLRVLWPSARPLPSSDPNDHATVLLTSYGPLDALLPADAESNVTVPLRPPPVELLKVGHHGSADEGLGELLERVHPSVAVISVGANNDYGHPAPSTLAALQADHRIAVYRTDRHGDIVVEAEGDDLRVRTDR
jgi:competence protein ComEC